MAQIIFTIPDADKAIVQARCAELGINMTTAYRMFTKKLITSRKFPLDMHYSDYDRKIDERLQDYKDGKYRVFKSVAEAEKAALDECSIH